MMEMQDVTWPEPVEQGETVVNRVHKELKVLMVIPEETETPDEMDLLVDLDMLETEDFQGPREHREPLEQKEKGDKRPLFLESLEILDILDVASLAELASGEILEPKEHQVTQDSLVTSWS